MRVYQFIDMDTSGAAAVDFTAHTEEGDPALFTINDMQTDMQFELTFRLVLFMHFYGSKWVPEVGLQSDGKITIWYEDDTIESDTTLDDFLGKVDAEICPNGYGESHIRKRCASGQ